MGSKSRAIRGEQRGRTEAELKGLVTRLRGEGLSESDINRHATVRKLRAEAGRARARLSAIDAKEALNAQLAERKVAKLEAAKSASKKKGKKGADKDKTKDKAKDKDKSKDKAKDKDKDKTKGGAEQGKGKAKGGAEA